MPVKGRSPWSRKAGRSRKSGTHSAITYKVTNADAGVWRLHIDPGSDIAGDGETVKTLSFSAGSPQLQALVNGEPFLLQTLGTGTPVSLSAALTEGGTPILHAAAVARVHNRH